MSRGLYDVEGCANASVMARPPVLWLHASALDSLKKGAVLTTAISVERFLYPSVNIVAAVAGTDNTLKQEYVLFSGHQDHDGVRQPYGEDCIYNGADDNASASVALLAIERAYKRAGQAVGVVCMAWCGRARLAGLKMVQRTSHRAGGCQCCGVEWRYDRQQ
jgi:hypothetical protein